MAMRVGPGPVFVYESLIFARRRQGYVGQALLSWPCWAGYGSRGGQRRVPRARASLGTRRRRLQAMARAGSSFFFTLAASSSRWCSW